MSNTLETRTEIPSTCTVIESHLKGEHGKMRYWVSKQRHGLPILFIHGYGALIEHWKSIMPCVSAEHTLYALDLYGFGYSARPEVPPSKELWAAQVATFIQNVIGEPTIVVGHSMGGMVSSQLARTYPDLLRGLVLVNSAGMRPTHEPSPFDRTLFSMIQINGLGELLAGAFTTSWGVRQGLLSSYYRKERVTDELVDTFHGPLRQPNGVRYYLATSRTFNNLILDINPGEVQTPTLIIWGEEDTSLPPQVAYSFKEQIFPHADIHMIAQSGHCPFDETPEAFCDALLPWVNQFVATPTSG